LLQKGVCGYSGHSFLFFFSGRELISEPSDDGSGGGASSESINARFIVYNVRKADKPRRKILPVVNGSPAHGCSGHGHMLSLASRSATELRHGRVDSSGNYGSSLHQSRGIGELLVEAPDDVERSGDTFRKKRNGDSKDIAHLRRPLFFVDVEDAADISGG
jgi:hypothetical protein